MAGASGLRVGSAAGLMLAVALLAAPAAAQEAPSTGDIKWAQVILKDKGFDIGGRADGKLTAQTRTALSAYQRSVGLPVTGQLDAGTVQRMMADRKPSATVGNLAAQKPGAGGSGAAPRVHERDPAPRAAPTERVDSAGDEVALLNPVVRGAAGDGPVPQAAPRAQVTTGTATEGAGMPAAAADEGFRPPGWLSYVVMAVIAATLALIGAAWWRSGRRRPLAEEGGPTLDPRPDGRREPSFGPREALVAGPRPTLTAERRQRR